MYDMKPDRVGWTVFDVETGQPALLSVRPEIPIGASLGAASWTASECQAAL
jgi:hypothetical protein